MNVVAAHGDFVAADHQDAVVGVAVALVVLNDGVGHAGRSRAGGARGCRKVDTRLDVAERNAVVDVGVVAVGQPDAAVILIHGEVRQDAVARALEADRSAVRGVGVAIDTIAPFRSVCGDMSLPLYDNNTARSSSELQNVVTESRPKTRFQPPP